MSKQKVTVYNYSGKDIPYFRLTVSYSDSTVVVPTSDPIPAGKTQVFEFTTTPALTSGYFNIGVFSDCMTLDKNSSLIVTDIATAFNAPNCGRPIPFYPANPINFISGDKYWQMDKDYYQDFMDKNFQTTYLLSLVSGINLATLTKVTTPPTALKDPPKDPVVAEDEPSSSWWIWLIVILVILAIISAAIAVGYYIYKKR